MEMRGMSGELLGTIGPSLSNPPSVPPVPAAAAVAAAATARTSNAPTAAQAQATGAPSRVSAAFAAKKRHVLAALHPPGNSGYADKSPKGSVDAQIVALIEEINGYEGLVTTSSCAGRVSVFLEGEGRGGGVGHARDGDGDGAGGKEDLGARKGKDVPVAVPGGKGLGGRWLFVSHEPVERGGERDLRRLFGLGDSSSEPSTSVSAARLPRLVKFAFEPLILHVLCASLKHAQPLLAAAVNAGFRESGVQSLKILDERENESQGVMVGIRTAGLGIESVIGIYDEGTQSSSEHACRAVVSEEYLALMVKVSEERFRANDERKERLRSELKEHMRRFAEQEKDASGWEDKEARARRKRSEGLKRQKMAGTDEQTNLEDDLNGDDMSANLPGG